MEWDGAWGFLDKDNLYMYFHAGLQDWHLKGFLEE